MDLRQERIQKRRPLLVAHRGVCGGNIPCNTREAFLAAILQRASAVQDGLRRKKQKRILLKLKPAAAVNDRGRYAFSG